MRKSWIVIFIISVSWGLLAAQCTNCDKLCTSFVAGKNATAGGYTMAGHTCDGNCDFHLRVVPAAQHQPGEVYKIEYEGLPGGFPHFIKATIPQVLETYKYFFIEVPFANEYQVFIGENTCASRPELNELTEEEALLDWTQLAALALQRAKTAREAVLVMGSLVEQYGLNGDAESYLICDPNEAWVMEIPGYTRQWVAVRVPDDCVAIHANRLLIGEVNLADVENFLASPRLIQHAIERGLYDPARDGVFHFAKIYGDPSSIASWGNRRREWRMLTLLKPSAEWDPNELWYPLFVKPDFPISPEWWINNIWRDYLKDTPFDLTQGYGAGPFGNPARPSIKGIVWERAIGIPRTSYSWVATARGWLPNPIGGIFWFAYDAPYSSLYVPFYVGITDTPLSWRTGDFTIFSPDSARWWFQILDNWSWLRFNEMNKEIRQMFDKIEKEQFMLQPYIEEIALKLYEIDPKLCEGFLTMYCTQRALAAEQAAKEMFYYLVAKYADGRPVTSVPERWLELFRLEQPGK